MKANIVSMPLALAALLIVPGVCRACACGCGIFQVGTSSMLPQGTGGDLFFEYDFQDQNVNWSGNGPSPRANNDDREIRTDFFTLGLQYFFNRDWGAQVQVPYDNRDYKATAGPSSDWSDLGDVRLEGIYTGFSPDQSLGVTFGTKLATGKFEHDSALVDRDTQLGTGSTDLLLGGFYRNNLTPDGRLDWFAQCNLDVPVFISDQYRPGLEVDAALGTYLNGISVGGVRISPIAQVLVSERGHDTGMNASHPTASGYQRILLSPGVEFDLHPMMIYADVELPVYQHFTGDQVAASVLYKVVVSYHF